MKESDGGASSTSVQAGESKRPHIIYPEESLSPIANAIAGFQHVIAMFGSTVLGPLLMGFDPNLAIFFSGIATILFWWIVGGKIPSYLGSSFSFIAAVIAATSYAGTGPNLNVSVALGGIVAAGAAYAAIGLVVMLVGYRWINSVMPPVVTGTIVAIIGLNLASVAVGDINKSTIDTVFGLLTILLVGLSAAYVPHQFLRRIPILIGGGIAYGIYFYCCNLHGMGAPIDFSGVNSAAWFGLPHFVTPVFTSKAAWLIAPVAVVLVAENLGHVKAVGVGTGRDLDKFLGRAFFADGLATVISASGGGTGVTTYAENIGVMAVTRNYSSRTFLLAGVFAILIGLSPKFGAIIHTIPTPLIGGLAFIVFGLISATAVRIWVEDRTDFTKTRNLLVVGVSLVIGAGNLSVSFGSLALGGIALGTVIAIALNYALRAGFD